jgi:hypothetical protein
MKKIYLVIALFTAFGFLAEAKADMSVPIQPGGVLNRKCGNPPYEGCVWCTLHSRCYFVQKCDLQQCTYTTAPGKMGPTGPGRISPVINGKPVAGKPINTAPIGIAKPVQEGSGGPETNRPVERSGGGGKR